jgi:D-amino-acid oxidase
MFRKLACQDETGVELTEGIELFRRTPHALPPWSEIAISFRGLSDVELAEFPGVLWGYKLTTPLANMNIYLPWLLGELAKMECSFRYTKLETLGVLQNYDMIINCSGLGARELVDDCNMQGVRGQYIVIEKSSEAPCFYIGDDENAEGITYVFPRREDVLVGGTEEYGVESMEFEEDISSLFRRARSVAPWLGSRGAFVVRKQVVGIRPYRLGGPRVEADKTNDIPIIHNYGHGGSGFSLSWGCAREVAQLVAQEVS